MKVLFLDIDGVLNHIGSFIYANKNGYGNGGANLDFDKCLYCPIAVSNLGWLLEELPDLKIVVSSSWRILLPWHELMRLLTEKALIPADRIIGKTDELDYHESKLVRGDEIQKWLDENTMKFGVESFAIIDDDSDMAHLKPYLVQTTSNDGLTFTKAQELRRKFL